MALRQHIVDETPRLFDKPRSCVEAPIIPNITIKSYAANKGENREDCWGPIQTEHIPQTKAWAD
eukprot:837885-Rhodomonas_salina.1